MASMYLPSFCGDNSRFFIRWINGDKLRELWLVKLNRVRREVLGGSDEIGFKEHFLVL